MNDQRPSSPPVIGLTGGIGAGKSIVADILAEHGCIVARSDEDARAVLREPAVRETLVSWWGREVLDPATGEIDRGRVAKIVFQDAAQRERLERLTHPRIEARRRALFAAAPPETPAFVIDAPLLMEAGLDATCDTVIFVEADRATRLDRLRRSRGWDESELDRRERAQLPLDVKRDRADYVVRNEGDRAALATETAAVLRRLVETG